MCEREVKKMINETPLVSVGIPTYNRAVFLKHSVESVLNQDYPNLRILISDNASTDQTQEVCKQLCDRDARITYIRQPINKGGNENFKQVFLNSSGDFFMWLGDDDWIEPSYITQCMNILIENSDYSLCCGKARYFLPDGRFIYDGIQVNLFQDSPKDRIRGYYSYVTDNGTFYGIMRHSQLSQLYFRNTMGIDWFFIASIAFMGKIKTLENTIVNRIHSSHESSNSKEAFITIASNYGLPKFQGEYPYLSIAISAFNEIAWFSPIYDSLTITERILLANDVQKLICQRYKISIDDNLLLLLTCLDRYLKDSSNQLAYIEIEKVRRYILNSSLKQTSEQLLYYYHNDFNSNPKPLEIFNLQK